MKARLFVVWLVLIVLLGTLCLLIQTDAFAVKTLHLPVTLEHRITRGTFARIEHGMTERDLENLLGVPPGDYGPGLALSYREFGVTAAPSGRWLDWLADDVKIRVYLDEEGAVTDKKISKRYYRESQPKRPAFPWFWIQ
ncbi:MAG: hypothetical protein HY040_09305 [Planctomycetes bacterium]|nr:hypothetical protein [Planctomycetota bacterium]